MTRSHYPAVADWCRARIAECSRRPLVIGISGPQGAGKSELAAWLAGALGPRSRAMSVDDFYLTRSAQEKLAGSHPQNPYLAHRGYPGTHDLALGTRVLRALRAGTPVRVPAYDKSAFAGRGDRIPEEGWELEEGPLQAVVLEGWLLGFEVSGQASGDPWLTATEALLPGYGVWNRLVDAWILLFAPDLEAIVKWRTDAEARRRERGQTALSEADARDYIERFLPAYRAWVPGLRQSAPSRGALVLELGPDRSARGFTVPGRPEAL